MSSFRPQIKILSDTGGKENSPQKETTIDVQAFCKPVNAKYYRCANDGN